MIPSKLRFHHLRDIKEYVGVPLICTVILLLGPEISLGQEPTYFYYGWGGQ